MRQAAQADPVDAAIGARIRIHRRARKVSQARLADALGVSFQKLAKIEGGKAGVSASELVKIANQLDTTPAALTGDGHIPPTARGGSELLLAFRNIEDLRVRRAVLMLVRALANSQSSAFGGAGVGRAAPIRVPSRPHAPR